MRSIKLKIYAKYISIQILILIALKYLTPLLFNYPPLSKNMEFQKIVNGLTHNELYLALGIILITTQTVFIYFILRKIFKYIEKGEINITNEETEIIRKNCFKIPRRLFFSQTLLVAIILGILYQKLEINQSLLIKFIIIYISFFTSGWSLAITLIQKDINKIIEFTYKINKNTTLPKRKHKLSLLLIKKIVPIYIALISTIVFLAYSKIINLNGNNSNYYYKKYIDNMQLTGLKEKDVRYELSTIPLLNESDYFFIIHTEKDEKFFSKSTGFITDFFRKYAKYYMTESDGRIYENYGIEEEAYAKYIKLNTGEQALIGIKYSTSNLSILRYLIGISLFSTIIFIIILILSTKNIGKVVKNITERIKQTTQMYITDEKVKLLPAVSADELGHLTMAYNEINNVTKEKSEELEKYKETLMKSEHLAMLGQMVGGISHNFKTPIISIAGATKGLDDLIDEYSRSIDDPEVNSEDHHEIAKEMKEWVKKINIYQVYMSEMLNTVTGQTANFNKDNVEDFTIKELLKRINILMKYQLISTRSILNLKCQIPMNTKIHGNINILVQIVNNLILNAIQSYEKNDENNSKSLIGKNNKKSEKIIILSITRNKRKLMISVEDFGKGIPKEVREKLFKSIITTKGNNGTGLGLFMSYSTIKKCFKGDIKFTSRVGKGSKFNIIIPI